MLILTVTSPQLWTAEKKEAIKHPSDAIGQTVVLETASFRVWSSHLEPNHILPFHKHCRPYFWTCHTVGKSRSYYNDGSILETEYTVNCVKNFPDLSETNFFIHNLENIGTTTLIFTTVEFFV